jgi:hypothetical protein
LLYKDLFSKGGRRKEKIRGGNTMIYKIKEKPLRINEKKMRKENKDMILSLISLIQGSFPYIGNVLVRVDVIVDGQGFCANCIDEKTYKFLKEKKPILIKFLKKNKFGRIRILRKNDKRNHRLNQAQAPPDRDFLEGPSKDRWEDQSGED